MKYKALLAAIALAASGSASAAFFTAGSGVTSASADFSLSGGNLVVTLTNTAAVDTTSNGNVLMAVLWSGTSGLTPLSAAVGSGLGVIDGTGVVAGATLGPNWQYKAINNYGATQGISAAGLGFFGPDGNFGGTPVNLDGADYGIVSSSTSAADIAANNGFKTPFVNYQAVFTLSGTNLTSETLAGITNVSFIFGTNGANLPTCDPTSTSSDCILPPAEVPLPAAAWLFMTGLLPLAGFLRKRREVLSV